MTDSVAFQAPVRVLHRPGGKVTEIGSAAQAFDYLSNHRYETDPIYECALEACFIASIDPSFGEEARQGLAAFAKSHGLLADRARP